MLIVAPILVPPVWELPIHVFVDASHIAFGAMLMQVREQGWIKTIYYASRVLNSAKRNYIVIEREAFGMVYSLDKFRHDLLSNRVHVDHSALLCYIRLRNLS